MNASTLISRLDTDFEGELAEVPLVDVVPADMLAEIEPSPEKANWTAGLPLLPRLRRQVYIISLFLATMVSGVLAVMPLFQDSPSDQMIFLHLGGYGAMALWFAVTTWSYLKRFVRSAFLSFLFASSYSLLIIVSMKLGDFETGFMRHGIPIMGFLLAALACFFLIAIYLEPSKD